MIKKRVTRALTLGIDKKVSLKSKRSQEEMVGFALIIIIVAVIMLIFLGFSLRSPQNKAVENYEVDSFIQSSLQYTTDCRDNLEYLSIQKLIFSCASTEECVNGGSSCEILETTLRDMLSESWKVDGERPVKGYKLEIISNNGNPLVISEGNTTKNYKGSSQDFFKGGNSVEVLFKAYY